MYKPKNYTIKELAHPQIINAIGTYNTWLRLEELALRELQKIRTKWFKETGSGVYCNRLNLGLDSRGLRPPNDADGKFYSTHKQGGTFDLEPVNGEHKLFWEFVYDMIANGELEYFNTMERREDTPTWTHVGRMNTNEKPLIIKP